MNPSAGDPAIDAAVFLPIENKVIQVRVTNQVFQIRMNGSIILHTESSVDVEKLVKLFRVASSLER